MRIIEQLVYKITGDNSEFDKSIDKSETKVSKFGSVADKMLAGVTVAAITMVVKKVGDMVVATAQATDRVDKMSQKIGISRTAFQEWDFILSQSGASVEGLQMGVKTLSNAADEARKGTALYTEAFDRLGVSVTDVNGNMKDQETLFNEVFKALANVDNQTERTAIANKLLGRSATELAPAFNAGSDAIESMRIQAHELGLVMSDELIDQGVVLTDNIDKLKRAYKGWKNEALEPLLGLAVTFTDKLLGQDSAIKNLKSTYNDLQTAVTNYNTILDTSKGKTDAITQSMVAQAKAQMQLALQSASESYRDSEKDIAKYSKSISDAEKWVVKYTKSLDAMAEGTGYTSSQLNKMTEAERNYALAMSTQVKQGIDVWSNYDIQLGALIETQKSLFASETSLSQAEASQENFINLLTQGYVSNNESTKLLLSIYPELEQKVLNNVKAYEKEQKEIEKRNKSIELATAAFRSYENASDEDLKRVIAQAKGQETSAYWAEMSRLATEKLNERIIENSLVTDKQTAILANNAQGMEAIDAYALALGDTYDATSEKTSLLTSTIKALIDAGINPQSEAVKGLVSQLEALSTQTTETGKTIEDVANTNIIPAAQVAFDTWRKEQERTADEAERQAERVKQAWEDATFSMLGSVTSIWGSINQVQANANAQLIATLEKTTAETLKNIDKQTQAKLEAEGVALETTEERLIRERDEALATGDEITANLKTQEIRRNEILAEADEEKKRIEEEANKRKIDMQIEEAERNKALSTLSVILDTAKAIMQIWANPLIAPWGKGLWTGLAAGAGAAQIAAINSAPVPSYDVGSIRIPETTQAVVHKDEMILTAPQAEQARREGITIAPTKSGGNSINLMIYLDGKEIARNTIDNLNSGSVGTIKARVVK